MTIFDVQRLSRSLCDHQWTIRRDAVEQVVKLGPEAAELLPQLWEVALHDTSAEVRTAACQAVWAAGSDRRAALSRLINMLKTRDRVQVRMALAMLVCVDLGDLELDEAAGTLWSTMRSGDLTGIEADWFSALLAVSPKEEEVLRRILVDGDIDAHIKQRLILLPAISGKVQQQILRDPSQFVPPLLRLLLNEELNERNELVDLITSISSSLDLAWQASIRDTLWKIVQIYGQGFGGYCRLAGQDEALSRLVNDPAIAQEFVGALLLADAPREMIKGCLVDNEYVCMSYIFEALVHPDWSVRVVAADWIGDNAANLPQYLYEQSIESLERRVRQDRNLEVQTTAEKALARLIHTRRQDRLVRQGKLVKMIRDESIDEETRAKALESLARTGSREAMAAVIQFWLQWIREPGGSMLVDLAADLIRKSKYAVLPLLNRLVQRPALLTDAESSICDASSQDQSEQRRIVGLLAEMSDERFFNGDTSLHGIILAELHSHAVPVLARRLPNESDIETREGIARVLAWVGGREAVAAVTRAIGSEERTRRFRQELLENYYLDPSKKRGEQASEILQGAVAESKRTLRVLQGLNVMVFVVGLVIIGIGLAAALTGEDTSSRVVGLLAALGTLGGLIVQLVYNPLDRIQTSVARLVQLETAFTSFIWELNLNSTYIQSLYVANGRLSDASIAKTVERMEHAMMLTVKAVQKTEDAGQQESSDELNNP